MNESLIPATLDARKAFRGETVIEGFWPVKKLDRLRDYLADDSGAVDVNLRFYTDPQRRRMIAGRIAATVQVRCERCLEVMPLELVENMLLAVVESEGLAERLPEEIDPWLTADEDLSVPDIIEEQLILAMPLINRHERTDCTIAVASSGVTTGTDAAGDGQKPNPFAVLEVLKTDRARRDDNGDKTH